MELVNTSPVPVNYSLSGKTPDDSCSVMFTAKATFRIEDSGRVRLEQEMPLPLWDEDQDTDLGLLPRDNLPRLDPVFEVMMLGKAYAPDGGLTTEMKVALSVGDVRHEIDVIGERTWQGEGEGASISAPEAFDSMPLTWERAYGGLQPVLIDREAEVDVSSPMNTLGKGFDHIGQARDLGVAFNCPEGYPQFDVTRPLPNLEIPDLRVQSWSDEPLPVCWAPVPHSSGLILERFKRSCKKSGKDYVTLEAPEMLHRAYPDWIIETPQAGAVIRIEGASEEGLLEFRLPELRIVADFNNGGKVQRIELIPRGLVLLPEERRFYLTYRSMLSFDSREDEKRVVRVKLLKGWCPDTAGESV